MRGVRVRYAPSPTGFVHLGGLRTALYNVRALQTKHEQAPHKPLKVLFARKHRGTFFVRIEDTDQSRQVEGSVAGIVDALAWAGMASDELLVYQSSRLPIYHEHAMMLLDRGLAYRCFCSKERLEGLRGAATTGMYPKFCLYSSPEDVKAKLRDGLPHTIRMKVPPSGKTVVEDVVRGKVVFDHHQVDDQVLLKSDGFPTYHLANVVDDHLMDVTHVIRGEEWLPSTVKHVLLYQGFGWKQPQFAHLPLLLSDRGGKLSKRHDDASVQSFMAAGFLPEALVNFVAFLGWTPESGREVLTLDEMVEEFSLERIHKGGAAVSRRKLEWLNAEHTARLLGSTEGRATLQRRFMAFLSKFDGVDADHALRVLDTIHSRLSVFSEIADKCAYFFAEPDWSSPEAVAFRSRVWNAEHSLQWLAASRTALAATDWTPDAVSSALKATDLPLGKLQSLLRYALTGTEVGASMPQTISTLGSATVLKRLDRHLQG